MRKLGLLWLLIQNGTLFKGSVLFWDEPEANLNPKVMKILIEILLKLQREGVQIFLATHDYVVLKEIDLQRQEQDQVQFVAMYREREQPHAVRCQVASSYKDIHENAIADTFADLYDREVKKALGA
jgi:AAA15 family ATPase/GTPase